MPVADPSPASIRLPERDAQAALLIAALEDADPAGRLLPLAERARASERALAGADVASARSPEALARVAARRAHLLLEGPERTGWRAALRATRLGAGAWPYVLVLALVAGLGSNVLGPDRHLNVLSMPMLGVLAWNLGVYAFLAVAALRRGRARDEPRRAPWVAAAIARARSRRLLHAVSEPVGRGARAEDAGAQALASYVRAWTPAGARLLAARARTVLHLGSAVLAIGTVAGMYARGLAFEYRATWESTFLSAGAAQGLLGAILGPAAWVLRTSVPDVAPLRGQTGDAAVWIHLWAATAAIYVVLPRAALAAFAAGRAARLAGAVEVPLAAGRLLRSLGLARAAPVSVAVVPYAMALPARAVESLKALFHDALSPTADVSIAPSSEYGAEVDPPGAPPAPDGTVRIRAIVFPMAQTPEPEVHGRFLADVRTGLAPAEALLVLVDESAFRTTAPPDRLAQRGRAWDSVVVEATGAPSVRVDLARRTGPDLASRVAAAVEGAGA